VLDQICYDYVGYVVAVEWHVGSSYPLYSAEGRAKWFMYPPPYQGAYATPWLWVDGRQRGFNYYLWRSFVEARLSEPTPVLITLSGIYDQTSRNGTIKAWIQNDSTEALTMRVSVVITEDSCYYVGPNGDPWHNHVCRDYIPNQYGTVLTIPAGGVDSVEQPFTIASNWNEERCKIVVYAQSTTIVPADSSYPMYQGAQVAVMELLVGVNEQKSVVRPVPTVTVVPNPSRGKVEFRFTTPVETGYRLEIYGTDGRVMKEFTGRAKGETRVMLKEKLPSGIYLYRLTASGVVQTGKLTIGE